MRLRPSTLAVVPVCAGVLLAGASAAQASPSFSWRASSGVVRAGHTLSITMRPVDAEICQFKTARSTKSVRLAGATKVRMRVHIARTARPAHYAITLACGATERPNQLPTAAFKLRVLKGHRRGHGRSLVSGKIGVRLTGAPGHALTADSPEVLGYWNARYSGLFERDFHNGQCTQLTYDHRADIVQRVEHARVAAWRNAGNPNGSYDLADWTAYHWAGNAASVGFAVDTHPTPNSILVIPRETTHNATGHVAWVASVTPDGSTFHVVEMNGSGGVGVIDERDIKATAIAPGGYLFIH